MRHHLGSRVSALVDGQLSPEATERALAHAAACPHCRRALEAERAARRALTQAPPLEPSGDLTTRLLALAGSGPGGPTLPAMVPPAVPARRRTGPRRWFVLSTTAAAAAVGGLYVLGDLSAPALAPEELVGTLAAAPDEADAVRPVAATGDVTAAAVGWLRESGWVAPAVIRSDLAVVDVRQDDGTVQVELVGSDARVLLVERRGHLDDAEHAGAERMRFGEVEAVVLAGEPWTAAVESGDVVVLVTCEGYRVTCHSVVAALPVEPADASPVGQVSRGWDAVVTAVSHAVPR